jgi:hypothetical protein
LQLKNMRIQTTTRLITRILTMISVMMKLVNMIAISKNKIIIKYSQITS